MELDTVYQNHLLGVAEFLEPNQGRRFLTLAQGGEKKVRKAFEMFHHDLRPKETSSKLLSGADGFADIIEHEMLDMGASTKAVILSAQNDIKEMSLSEALRNVVGFDAGTIISSIPGKLAFWESGSMNYRYILYNNKGTK